MNLRIQHHTSTGFLLGFAIIILAVILPVSAAYYTVAQEIDQGATIYIGEQGLNLTHALNRAGGLAGPAIDAEVPTNRTTGWWASASTIEFSAPTKMLNISTRYNNFTVAPADFVGYTGTWYLVNPATGMAFIGSDGLPRMVFTVNDPQLNILIWDFDLAEDMTGKTTMRGDSIGFRVDTNMQGALNNLYRSPVYHNVSDGYIDINVRNASGHTLTQLTDSLNTPRDLLQQNVSSPSWTWGDPANPASPHPWSTMVTDGEGQPVYPEGTYTVWAASLLNNMKENYKNAGADYTGKTVSQACTITLVNEYVNIESNRDSVARGAHFSVTITGRPKTAYYLWVNNTGSMTGNRADQPPTIRVSAPVYQDPAEGPYAIGTHPILNGGGKNILEDIPPSTGNVSRNEYYAKVVTSSRGTATVELRTSPDSKPGTFAIRAEKGSFSDDVIVEVDPFILPVAENADEDGKVIYHPLINPDIPAPVNTDLKRISREGTIFVGEEGLNVSGALASANAVAVPVPSPQGTVIGWWASAAIITSSSPTKTVDLSGRDASLLVSPADFVGYTGNWYLVNPSNGMAAVQSDGTPILVFTIADPALDLKIWDLDVSADQSGRSVPQGERLTFRVGTNLYQALDPVARPDITGSTAGIINIVVKTANGARLNYLYQNNTTANTLLNQRVNTEPWLWGNGGYWATDLLDRDRYSFYPVGTYTVWAESTLNNMKNNYKNAGADYTGKTVSSATTITLVTDRVTIETNKGAVTRGKPFSVFVYGRPGTPYYLWVKDTGSLTGGTNNEAPMISLSQEKVYLDSPTDPAFPIGSYQYQDGGGQTIKMNVGTDPVYNGTRYYSEIMTSTSGIRSIEFQTNSLTRNRTYTIRVENLSRGHYQSDEVNITVERGPASGIGAFRNPMHIFYIDNNSNGRWDGAVTDRQYNFGLSGDLPVSGDWNLDGRTEIGVFRNAKHMFYLDNNSNGRWDGAVTDRQYNFGLSGDLPVSGDWNLDGRTEIGVFRSATHMFYLDNNSNGRWDGAVTDRQYNFGLSGDLPVSGDWNLDGRTEIGVFRSTTHMFYLDNNSNGRWDGAVTDRQYIFGLSGDLPVSGDWNLDGRTEIGVFRNATHMFYLDNNSNGRWDGAVTDRQYNFGLSGDLPVSGDW